MKKLLIYVLITTLALTFLNGCTNNSYKKYEDSFFDTFDTVITVIGYAQSKEEFESYMGKIHNRFLEFHKLFDKYESYEGINNIKTINDNAGIKAVEVEKEIIDLILFSKKWYYKTGQKTNIAMGPVINIWSEYREKAVDNPDKAKLPSIEELKEASKYTDIEKVIVDEEKSSIFLEDSNMSLDVGAVAKGYALELIAMEMETEGFKSALISAGGDIRSIGKPMERKKEKWIIGIQNPDSSLIDRGNILETISMNEASVVSSGDNQRYFIVDEKIYHHIIDPDSLMPGDYYRAVTVVTPDSGIADFLSTSIFLLPFDEGKTIIESIDETDALWVMKDGKIKMTEGMKELISGKGVLE